MQNRKKFVSIVLALLLVFMYSMPVFATDQKAEGLGSMEIVLTDGSVGTSKENVTFEYAKVADIVNGEYVLLEAYKDVKVDLNEIELSADLDKAAQEINQHVVANDKVTTDKQGIAVISDLVEGVYLIRVSDKSQYENVTPALIAIPTWNEEQGTMDYQVTVYPKHSPNEPEPVVPEETPATGDTNSYLWYMLFVVASLGLIMIVIRDYRKSKKEQ